MDLMKKNWLNVWKTFDNIYRMHWGGADTTLSGQVILMAHDIGTDSVQWTILCDCIFQFGKDI